MSTEMKVNGSNKEICLKQFLSKLARNWLKKNKEIGTHQYIYWWKNREGYNKIGGRVQE